MFYDDFIFVPGTSDVCLAYDTGITQSCLKAGRLDWDTRQTEIWAGLGLGPKHTILDIGANIGDTTRTFTKSGATVFAFECQPDAFVCLVHNCPDAICLRMAIGNGERVSMHGGRGGNLGARPVYVKTDGDVLTVPLDLVWFPRVDFVKLDIEGHEVFALSGMRHLISRHHPTMLVELNEPALARNGHSGETVKQILKTHGYEGRIVVGEEGTDRTDWLFWRPT